MKFIHKTGKICAIDSNCCAHMNKLFRILHFAAINKILFTWNMQSQFDGDADAIVGTKYSTLLMAIAFGWIELCLFLFLFVIQTREHFYRESFPRICLHSFRNQRRITVLNLWWLHFMIAGFVYMTQSTFFLSPWQSFAEGNRFIEHADENSVDCFVFHCS